MQMGSLQIDSSEIRFGQVDAAKIRFDPRLAAGFHPLFVLIQNFGQIEQGNRYGFFADGSFGGFRKCFFRHASHGYFAFQFFDFFDRCRIRTHSNSFPQLSSWFFAHARRQAADSACESAQRWTSPIS